MKKRQFFAVLVMVACFAFTANAEGLNLEGIEAQPKEFDVVGADEIIFENKDKGIFETGSTDIVEIDDSGVFNVKTEKLDTTLYPPFGWVCLTQDVGSQFAEYATLIKDPMSMAQEMVESGTHYTLISPDFHLMTEFRIVEDDYIGAIIDNSSYLTGEDEQTICSYLETNCFSGEKIAAKTIGPHRYYSIVVEEEGAAYMTIYETYVNKCCIDVVTYAVDENGITDEDLEEIEYMLEGFLATAL